MSTQKREYKTWKEANQCNIKVIVHFKIFFDLNLIFWIVQVILVTGYLRPLWPKWPLRLYAYELFWQKRQICSHLFPTNHYEYQACASLRLTSKGWEYLVAVADLGRGRSTHTCLHPISLPILLLVVQPTCTFLILWSCISLTWKTIFPCFYFSDLLTPVSTQSASLSSRSSCIHEYDSGCKSGGGVSSDS